MSTSVDLPEPVPPMIRRHLAGLALNETDRAGSRAGILERDVANSTRLAPKARRLPWRIVHVRDAAPR
jgi:hypothetical protein